MPIMQTPRTHFHQRSVNCFEVGTAMRGLRVRRVDVVDVVDATDAGAPTRVRPLAILLQGISSRSEVRTEARDD